MAVQSSSRQRPAKKSSGRRKSSKQASPQGRGNWLVAILGLTTLALLSAIAGAFLAISMASVPLGQSKLTPTQAAVFSKEKTISYKNLNLPQLSRPVNILVLGTKVLTADVGQSNPAKQGYLPLVNSLEGLTDTMMLIRIDPENKKLTLISIPRDTQTEIPGYGLRKINEANANGGPALAAQSVSHLLGDLPIDRYVRVNVQAVEKLVDALGGVTVYVPKRMKYQDDSQHLYINLNEGEQHLDGDKTLQLLRFRHDRMGDIGRIQRQQMVTRALIEQALKPQTILKIPEIISILQAYIDTNLNMEELVAIAGLSAQMERGNVRMLMLPGDFSGNGRRATSYWLPNHAKIKDLMNQYFRLNVSENYPENNTDETEIADKSIDADDAESRKNSSNSQNGDGAENAVNTDSSDLSDSSVNSMNADTSETTTDSGDSSENVATVDHSHKAMNNYNTESSESPASFTHSVMISSEETEENADSQDPKYLRIAIQDSINNPIAMHNLVRHLKDAGYSRIRIVDNWRQPLKMTRIIAPHGDNLGAAKVRDQLGLGEVLIDSNGYLVSDVTIQVGQDWVQRSQTLFNSY